MSTNVIPFKKRAKDSPWEKATDSKGRPVPHLHRHKPSGVYHVWVNFKKLGIPQLRKSTEQTTLGAAKNQAQVLKQQWINQHLGIDDSHVFKRKAETTFGDVVEEVLKDYTPEMRVGTQNNHKIYMGELSEHWGNLDINSITPKTFKDLIRKFRRTKKRKTFMDYQKAANIIMRYAYNEMKCCTHLIHFSDPDGEHVPDSRVFTDAEIKRLWDAMNEETRDEFTLSYECFMRLREMLYLTWDRFNLETGIVTLRAQDVKTGSKTGKGRSFKVSDHALTRMRARYAKRDKRSPYVFPSPKNFNKPIHQNKTAWSAAKAAAKIKGKARWHDLRHTALSKALLEQKLQPLFVSEYAGVSMRTIQKVYLHSTAEHTQGVANAISVFGVNGV